MSRWRTSLAALTAAAVLAVPSLAQRPKLANRPASRQGGWATGVSAKPLSENVKRGLSWLASTQQKGGGWSQGEESAAMGHTLDNLRDVADVGDTCAAALAMLRSGSTPRQGRYARNIAAAIGFVCGQIEESDAKSLYITKTRGTRLQMKLGPYIDTFMASLLLAEAKGQMPDAQGEKRLAAAFHKVMDKIEKNQRQDGTWDQNGWAPVLSQGFAAKAINRAAQGGYAVKSDVLHRVDAQARGQFNAKTGAFGGAGSAGVQLYSYAANLGTMQESDRTNQQQEARFRAQAANGKTAGERKQAASALKRIAATRSDYSQATKAVIGRLNDQQFMSGFGSNGGEEFLSYNNIGETLVVKGGPEWQKWDREMTANLVRIQNKDGTWTGHHCITGRTFCTAAALLTLTVDRAPTPVAAKMRRQ